MQYYIEKLPGCKTSSARAIKWIPALAINNADGLLEIHDKKTLRKYLVTEFFPDRGWIGRAFRFVKPEGEQYNCFVARDGRNHSCDCKAGTYAKVARCAHVEAMLAIIENNWLEDPRNDPRPTVWPHPEQLQEPC